MDIKINCFQHNQLFSGRKAAGYTQLQMLQKMPELLSKKTSLAEISEETGRTQSSILQWIKDNTGKTFGYFQRKAEQESYRDIMTQYRNERKGVNEIAALIGKSKEWTRKCLHDLGLCKTREDLNKYLDNEIPKLIEQGYTIEAIAKTLNISKAKVADRIKENYNNSIVKIRHQNKTLIRRTDERKYADWKKEFAEYLAAGMSLTEISRITGRPLSRLLYWLRLFGFSTKNQKAHELMEKKVPEMMHQGMLLKDMVKVIGLSDATISRWIKKTYGKTYSDLRLCK